MAARPRQFQVGGSGNAGNGGDTAYTKIFVGGLAWETQRDTMRRYFEQFGEILEAVVITDKNTGRSKGYGFVTFKDPDSAMRACQDPSPVIDGRRANCNLASLGASHRTRPHTPQHAGMARFRPAIASSAYHGSSTTSSYFHQPAQFGYPYSPYGYSAGYTQENMYPMSYYGVYGGSGGQHHQFSPYYTAGPGVFHNFYPYYAQYAQTSQAPGGYGLQYPQLLQYPHLPQQYGSGILSVPGPIAATAGMTTAAMAGSSSSQQPPGSTLDPKPSS